MRNTAPDNPSKDINIKINRDFANLNKINNKIIKIIIKIILFLRKLIINFY